jgi:hypothetical protein
VDHTIRTTTYVAAVFMASLIGVGMSAAQAGSPPLTFKQRQAKNQPQGR